MQHRTSPFSVLLIAWKANSSSLLSGFAWFRRRCSSVLLSMLNWCRTFRRCLNLFESAVAAPWAAVKASGENRQTTDA